MRRESERLKLPLSERRKILRDAVVPNDRVQVVEVSQNAAEITHFVRENHLEGLNPTTMTPGAI